MEESGKQKLTNLEGENKYVFHGSGFLIRGFEPRQAHNYVGGRHIPDGEPAVFASPFADYAIFMALINESNFPKGFHSSVRFRGGKPIFGATKKTLAQLKTNAKGYVYVFDCADFTKLNDSEWVSHKRVEPTSIIPVTRLDFTPAIKTIDCK